MHQPLPAGPFGAIMCDPPWRFTSYGGKHLAPTQGTQPYSTMSMADLRALPVSDIADRDCLLFMWTVSHLQREAMDLAGAWGFKPVSVAFVWDKGRMGMGYWTRQEVEICHLFKLGKPKRLGRGVRQVIRAPRREHSRKPDEAYGRVQALVAGPYLEMFARQAWPGWTAWGNEMGRFHAELPLAANDNQEVRACA